MTYVSQYEDDTCDQLRMIVETHYILEHQQGSEYKTTLHNIFYTLSEELMKKYTCYNVKAGVRYAVM